MYIQGSSAVSESKYFLWIIMSVYCPNHRPGADPASVRQDKFRMYLKGSTVFNDELFHVETLIRLCKSTQSSQHSICHVILMLHWKLNDNTLILNCKLKEKNKPMSLSWTILPAKIMPASGRGMLIILLMFIKIACWKASVYLLKKKGACFWM